MYRIELFVLAFSTIILVETEIALCSPIRQGEDVTVAETLHEIGRLLRKKNNLLPPSGSIGARKLMEISGAETHPKLHIEDDMRLTVPQATRMLDYLKSEMGVKKPHQLHHHKTRRSYKNHVGLNRRDVYAPTWAKWTFPIACVFDGSHSDLEKQIIRQGVSWWQEATCAQFVEYPTEDAIGQSTHLVVTKGDGCWSYVGKTGLVSQPLSLGDGCVTPGISAHEFGHALGLWHEHMRPDRDNHIIVNLNNAISGYEAAFAKTPPADDLSYDTAYDVTSVMHYDSMSFSSNYWSGLQTILPLDFSQITAIGNRLALSFADAKRINLHYDCVAMKCSSMGELSQPCQNGGYRDPNNCAICRCPIGTSGTYCQTIGAPSPLPTGSCGGPISVKPCSSVTISSPSFPNYYPALTTCSWQITSPTSLILAMIGQPDLPCTTGWTCNDYLEVRKNFSSLDLPGDFYCMCGRSSGRIVIDGGHVLVNFVTTSTALGGGAGAHAGFQMVAYATCPGTVASALTPECIMTPFGYDYDGIQNKTDAGKPCVPWSGQSTFSSNSFPDVSLLNSSSSCRNPNSAGSPWCYTSPDYSPFGIGWCSSIPKCPTGLEKNSTAISDGETAGNCRLTEAGHEYTGKLATTSRGYTCQAWSSQSPHKHNYTVDSMFPDNSVALASNYCRHPSGSSTNGVWCYTTTPHIVWDTCEVAMCNV